MKDQYVFARLGVACVLVASLVVGGCASKSPAPVTERGGQPAAPAVATIPGKDIYTVKKGDTLYSIALDHGVDYKELAAWNNIENRNRIQVGQSLRIRAPGAPVGTDVAVAKPVAIVPSVEKRSLDGSSDTLKREPKAGKEPYSEQALAQAQSAQKPVEAGAVSAVKPEARVEAKPDVKPAEPAAAGDEIVWSWPANGKTIGTFSEGVNKGLDIAGKAGDPVLAAGAGKVILVSNALRGYGNMVVINHSSAWLTVYAHSSKILVKEGQIVTKGQKIAEMGNSDADQVKLHFEVRHLGKPVDPLKYLPQR